MNKEHTSSRCLVAYDSYYSMYTYFMKHPVLSYRISIIYQGNKLLNDFLAIPYYYLDSHGYFKCQFHTQSSTPPDDKWLVSNEKLWYMYTLWNDTYKHIELYIHYTASPDTKLLSGNKQRLIYPLVAPNSHIVKCVKFGTMLWCMPHKMTNFNS